jgi:UrcA family protein
MKTAHAFASSASGKALHVGIASLCFALSAQAGDGVAAGTVRTPVPVSYDDLNLANPAGARTLYARLKSAAEKACGSRPSGHDLQESLDYQSCYQSALDKAVRKVNSGQLQALHRNRADTSTG